MNGLLALDLWRRCFIITEAIIFNPDKKFKTMANVDMSLNPNTKRVFTIGATHDIAAGNPDFSARFEGRLVAGEKRDFLVVINRTTNSIVAEVDLGSEKKPPIIG